ncbi:MAG TPA: hypothetical protein VMX97_06305, partial [Hyphomicrobiaceae bacterium]|nr:hypothetical protein [Hyphomicrobiaceae bacterium]
MRFIPILLVLGVLLTVGTAPGFAQTANGTVETPALQLERWDAEAALVEKLLENDIQEPNEIDGLRATLEAQRAAIPVLAAQTQAELTPLLSQTDALGTTPDLPGGEDPVLAGERARLTALITATESRLKRASQADARAIALLARLSELRQKLFTQELLTRGPALFDAGTSSRGGASIGRVALVIKSEVAERIAVSRMDGPV